MNAAVYRNEKVQGGNHRVRTTRYGITSKTHALQIKLATLLSAAALLVSSPSIAFTQTPENSAAQRTIEIKNPVVKAIQTISVASGLTGIIAEVPVREGDYVKPQSLLAKIRDDEAVIILDRSKQALKIASLKAERDIDIRLAEKSLQVAEQELARAIHANEIAADTYPPNEIDRYKLLADRARFEVERAKQDRLLAAMAQQHCELEVRQSQLAVSRHAITSPIKAIVMSVDKQPGEWVDANTKIMELIMIDRLRIEGFIDAEQAMGVANNTPVQITGVGPVKVTLQGKIVFVSPAVNPVNQQVRVFVEFANESQTFRPGVALSARVMVPHATESKP